MQLQQGIPVPIDQVLEYGVPVEAAREAGRVPQTGAASGTATMAARMELEMLRGQLQEIALISKLLTDYLGVVVREIRTGSQIEGHDWFESAHHFK